LRERLRFFLQEDDWENKDEVELMNLRKASPMVGANEPTSVPQRLLPLEYPLGQWSPDNPNGKKVYDRKFLLQFENRCAERPMNMPEMEEIIGYAETSPNLGLKNSKENWRANQSNAVRNHFIVL
jgi:hypothetical protein